MLTVSKITNENIEEIKELYEIFRTNAQKDFFFEAPPLSFNDFKANFQDKYIKGFFCKDKDHEGFLLYSDNLNEAIEITIIYTANKENNINTKKTLMENFLNAIKSQHNNKLISYPMLGIQGDFIADITNFDFKLIGEMIVDFNFSNPKSQLILSKSKINPLPLQYSLDCWKNAYYNEAVKIIQQEFSTLNDAKFDSRFLTTNGTQEILSCIIQSCYGDFLPQTTTVLKHNDTPIGFCFTNLTTPEIANIPLIVVDQKYKGKGLGAIILKNSLCLLNNEIENNKLTAKTINATCDTDNFSAVKTYRKLGFKEQTYYTHAYLKI